MNEHRRRLMGVGRGEGPKPIFHDRLVFDGTAFIQTDIVLPADCSIAVTIGGETSKAGQSILGATGGGGAIALIYGGATNTTRRQMVPYYDSDTYLASNRYLEWTYTSFAFYMTPNRFGWGNAGYNYSKGSLHPTGGLSLGKTSISSRRFTGYMTPFYIYGSDASGVTSYQDFANYTPIYTLRPCVYENEAGMWCVELRKFYGNSAGEGNLSVTG